MIEEREPRIEASFVVTVNGAEPDDGGSDTCSLWTTELRLLQIDVVNDLRNRADPWLADGEPFHEHLERAVVAFVRVLRLEHIEAELARLGTVALCGHELEVSLRIYEAPDQPGAGDAVHLHSGSRHPDATPERPA